MKPTSSIALALLLVTTTAAYPVHAASETQEVPSTLRTFELPLEAGKGEAKQVSVRLDESHLKIATIALRRGGVLPGHAAPVPVTIQVLEGEGTLDAGQKSVAISTGSLISLGAGVEHAVTPRGEGDMFLLVHYLRGPSQSTSQKHDH